MQHLKGKAAMNAALDWLAERGIPRSTRADTMMIAIMLQESDGIHRDQIVPGKRLGVIGPATGLWQFERGGGVKGVLEHFRTRDIAHSACLEAGVVAAPDFVWRSLVINDWLAAVFARLLLWSDPASLPPSIAACEEEAWRYYQRTWRPGKPLRRKWTTSWRTAISA